MVVQYDGRWFRLWVMEQRGTWAKLVDRGGAERRPDEAIHGEAYPTEGEAWRRLWTHQRLLVEAAARGCG
jgi:hypothetical protein